MTSPTRGRAPTGSRRPAARPRRRPGDRLYLGGLLLLVVLLGAMALGPYGDYTVATDRVTQLSETQEALTAAVEALSSEEARLQDPAALEELARDELGLVRPGEIPFIVVNPATEEPVHLAGAAVTGEAAEEDPPWWVRIIDRLRDLLR